jgi:hypothetical protein
LRRIGEHAFKYCVSLRSICISSRATLLGEFCVDGCNALENAHSNLEAVSRKSAHRRLPAAADWNRWLVQRLFSGFVPDVSNRVLPGFLFITAIGTSILWTIPKRETKQYLHKSIKLQVISPIVCMTLRKDEQNNGWNACRNHNLSPEWFQWKLESKLISVMNNQEMLISEFRANSN